MNKKILLLIFLVLLFFAGIIALTQEMDFFPPDLEQEEIEEFEFEQTQPARWFRSNSGGMALEEVQSKLVALRSEYALAVVFARDDELPDFLLPYFESGYRLEIRALYRRSEQIRTQWLLKDNYGITRLNAVFLEKHIPEVIEEIPPEAPVIENINSDTENTLNEINENITNEEEIIDNINNDPIIEIHNEVAAEPPLKEEIIEIIEVKKDFDIDNRTGFIELFNELSVLTAEYRFFEDGVKNKTEYEVKDNLLISSVFLLWEEGQRGGYKKTYTDSYRYNRSSSLRSIERTFHTDIVMSYDQLIVNFPVKLLDVSADGFFITERLNLYPDYFGDVFILSDSRMVFETDERGRIIKQTLYDEDNEIIWVIQNTWENNRIVSTVKKEDGDVMLSEYQYNAAGDRISEKNYKNGILERLVRTEGRTDIEELYMNNVLVLRAEWEDGILISETRIRN